MKTKAQDVLFAYTNGLIHQAYEYAQSVAETVEVKQEGEIITFDDDSKVMTQVTDDHEIIIKEVDETKTKIGEIVFNGWLLSTKHIEFKNVANNQKVLLAVVPHIYAASSHPSLLSDEEARNRIASFVTDRHLKVSFSKHYMRQAIVQTGYCGRLYYCDLDCDWTEIEL